MRAKILKWFSEKTGRGRTEIVESVLEFCGEKDGSGWRLKIASRRASIDGVGFHIKIGNLYTCASVEFLPFLTAE
jgi:hypothetical protein